MNDHPRERESPLKYLALPLTLTGFILVYTIAQIAYVGYHAYEGGKRLTQKRTDRIAHQREDLYRV